MEVECDNCGETFDKKPAKVERSDRDFCSRDCYDDFGHPGNNGDSRVEKTCETCGETYKVYPYRADDSRYCGRKCADKGDYQVTGEDHGMWKGEELQYTCETCGDEFRRHGHVKNVRFCSEECYNRAKSGMVSGEDNPVWRGGWEWYYGANWDEQRAAAIERDDHRCQDCLKPEHKMDRQPDVHHKKRLGWFKEEYDEPTWWELGNRLANLVTLCRECHQKREWSTAD